MRWRTFLDADYCIQWWKLALLLGPVICRIHMTGLTFKGTQQAFLRGTFHSAFFRLEPPGDLTGDSSHTASHFLLRAPWKLGRFGGIALHRFSPVSAASSAPQTVDFPPFGAQHFCAPQFLHPLFQLLAEQQLAFLSQNCSPPPYLVPQASSRATHTQTRLSQKRLKLALFPLSTRT